MQLFTIIEFINQRDGKLDTDSPYVPRNDRYRFGGTRGWESTIVCYDVDGLELRMKRTLLLFTNVANYRFYNISLSMFRLRLSMVLVATWGKITERTVAYRWYSISKVPRYPENDELASVCCQP